MNDVNPVLASRCTRYCAGAIGGNRRQYPPPALPALSLRRMKYRQLRHSSFLIHHPPLFNNVNHPSRSIIVWFLQAPDASQQLGTLQEATANSLSHQQCRTSRQVHPPTYTRTFFGIVRPHLRSQRELYATETRCRTHRKTEQREILALSACRTIRTDATSASP